MIFLLLLIFRSLSGNGQRIGKVLFPTSLELQKQTSLCVRITWLFSNFWVRKFLIFPVDKWLKPKLNIWKTPCVRNFPTYSHCANTYWKTLRTPPLSEPLWKYYCGSKIGLSQATFFKWILSRLRFSNFWKFQCLEKFDWDGSSWCTPLWQEINCLALQL